MRQQFEQTRSVFVVPKRNGEEMFGVILLMSAPTHFTVLGANLHCPTQPRQCHEAHLKCSRFICVFVLAGRRRSPAAIITMIMAVAATATITDDVFTVPAPGPAPVPAASARHRDGARDRYKHTEDTKVSARMPYSGLGCCGRRRPEPAFGVTSSSCARATAGRMGSGHRDRPSHAVWQRLAAARAAGTASAPSFRATPTTYQ
jgi:hypothetical protein